MAIHTSPVQGSESYLKERDDSDLLGEMVRVKRDAALEPRDLELAEMHNVNLTMMYKHSIIKRDNGDHVTIWVDNEFMDIHGPKERRLDRHQRANLYRAAYYGEGHNDYCRDHDRRDWNSEHAPTTSGVNALRQWAQDHRGFFGWGEGYGGSGWRKILVAGSNGGSNAQYRARVQEWYTHDVNTWVETEDVADDAEFALDRQRNFNGKWRASSYGWETCGLPGSGGGRVNYELGRTDDPVQ